LKSDREITMKFDPQTEEQLQTQALAPEGTYRYRVIQSEDAVSRAGNEYIKMTLKICDENGVEHGIFTNLALMHLLKHFCDVNDMQEAYLSGNIPASECAGKSGGMVIVKIEPPQINPDGGLYRAKNVVRDYIVAPKGSMMKPLPEVKNNFPDDEIPF
jgi:hypothetical protein